MGNSTSNNIPNNIFESFFLNSIDLLSISDKNGYFIKLNKEWEKTLGYSLQELEGQAYINFVHPDDLVDTLNAAKQLAKQASVSNFKNRYKCKDGSYKWIEWRSQPINDYIFATARDITKQVENEQQLKESEELNKLITSITTDYFICMKITSDNKVLLSDVSDNFTSITGLNKEDIYTEKDWKKIYHYNDIPKVESFIEEIIKTGKPNEIVCRTIIRNKTRWINISAKPILNEKSNKVIKFYAAVKDITEEKRFEEELLKNQKLLIESQKAANIGNWEYIINEDKLIWSEQTYNIYGIKNKILKLNFKTSSDLTHPDDRKYVEDKYLSSIKLKLVSEYEYRIIRPDNSIRNVKVIGKVDYKNNKPYRTYGIIQDITDQKKHEQEFKKLADLNQTILDTVNVGIVFLKNRKMVWTNSLFSQILGYTQSELHDLDTSIVYKNKEEYEKSGEIAYKKITKGNIYNFETEFKKKDGSLIWVYLAGKAINHENLDEGTIWMVQDINEKKKSELALLKNQKLLTDSQRITHTGSWDIDVSSNYLFLSDEALNIYRIKDKKQISLETYWGMVIPEDRHITKNHFEETLKTKEFKDFECRVKCPDGEIIIVRNVGEIVFNDEGNLIRMFGVVQDITESKIAKEALIESEERARLFVENTPLPIALFDTNMNYIIASKQWYHTYNIGDLDLTGHNHYDIFPETTDTWKDLHQRAINGEVIKNDKDKFIRQDGSVQWVRYKLHPWYKGDKTIGGMVAFTEDITDKVKADEALKESEQIRQSIFNVAPIGLGFVKDRIIIDINSEVCKMSGYSREELINKSAQILYTNQEEYERIGKILYQELKDNGFSKLETTWKRKDGKILNIYQIITLINPDDPSKGIASMSMDITEQKEAEKRVLKLKDLAEESKQKMQRIYEFAPVSIGLLRNRVIVDVNSQVCNITWYKKEELIGKKTAIVFPSKNEFEKVGKLMYKQLKEDGFGELESIWKRKDGKHINVYLALTYLNPEDPSKGILFTALDISKQKEVEKNLIKEKERAEKSDKLKEVFLQNLSHEVRTPLNAIVGFSNLLNNRNDLTTNDITEYTSLINRSSQQLLSIVTDIITISKIQTDQEKVNLKPIDINKLLDQIYFLYKPIANDKHIDLSYAKGSIEKQFMIITDETKLAKIISNLLDNAIKFTHEGNVHFKYLVSENKISFIFKDTGIGINKEAINSIFERFRQADYSTHINYGGTGLGLSISKSFTEMLGGTIKVESELNKGTTFRVTIPLKKEEIKIQPEKTKEVKITSSLKILVAEDEMNNFLLIDSILSNTKISLMHAFNGKEAVNIITNNPDINIVLMDIKMPVMDGITAFHKIKKVRPNLPIIAVTAYALENDKQDFLKIGFDDYISKPIEINTLLDKINRVANK